MSGKVIASSDIIGVIPAANLPPSGGGAPVDAPYLLNGVDPSGDLTAQVNVLALATPQPFTATAGFGMSATGIPIILRYDDGNAGADNDSTGLPFQTKNDANTLVDIGLIEAEMTDATDTAVESKLCVSVSVADTLTRVVEVDNSGISLVASGQDPVHKTVTTATGDLTVATTGGNFTSGSAGRANNLATFLASATTSAIATLKAELNDGVLPTPTILDVKLDLNTNKTGEFANVDTLSFSPDGATQTITTGDALDLVSSKLLSIRSIGTVPNTNVGIGATGDVVIAAGGSDRWAVVGATGELQAQGAGAKITNVDPGTTTGDVVVFEQILDAGVATPVDAGPAVAIVPGASFVATATFTAPNNVAGNFLLQNNTGKTITLIGARVLIPGAAVTLSINVFNGATSLFFSAALTGPGGGHVPCTASYSLANAAIANGGNITVVAAGALGTVDTILFLEYIVQ